MFPGPGPGRPPGSPNKFPALLQKAIAEALAEHGSNGAGLGGLKGFVHWALANHPKEVISIVGKMLPRSVIIEVEEELPRERRTPEEVRADLERLGFTIIDRPPPPAILRNAPLSRRRWTCSAQDTRRRRRSRRSRLDRPDLRSTLGCGSGLSAPTRATRRLRRQIVAPESLAA